MFEGPQYLTKDVNLGHWHKPRLGRFINQIRWCAGVTTVQANPAMDATRWIPPDGRHRIDATGWMPSDGFHWMDAVRWMGGVRRVTWGGSGHHINGLCLG